MKYYHLYFQKSICFFKKRQNKICHQFAKKPVLCKRKGLENNYSVSLLKQTPAINGCPPFLAVLSFPNGIHKGHLFPSRKRKAPDELRRQSRFPKENAEGVSRLFSFGILPMAKRMVFHNETPFTLFRRVLQWNSCFILLSTRQRLEWNEPLTP